MAGSSPATTGREVARGGDERWRLPSAFAQRLPPTVMAGPRAGHRDGTVTRQAVRDDPSAAPAVVTMAGSSPATTGRGGAPPLPWSPHGRPPSRPSCRPAPPDPRNE